MLGISLEEVTGIEYAKLRRSFLSSARKHYNKAVWKTWENGYLQGLMGTGLVIGGGGMVASYFTGSQWCIIPIGVGIMNITQAGLKKRKALKEIMKVLGQRTAGLTSDELEQRIRNNDYSMPQPTRKDMQDVEMGVYAVTVAQAVAEKDYKFTKYPWPSVGVGLLAYGAYQGFGDNPVAGGMTMTMGGLILLGASLLKKRKITKIAERAHEHLKQKGYDHFDSYVRNREPYDFYQRFMQGKIVATD